MTKTPEQVIKESMEKMRDYNARLLHLAMEIKGLDVVWQQAVRDMDGRLETIYRQEMISRYEMIFDTRIEIVRIAEIIKAL